ncbi:hypothetical protein GCK32_007764 [Trichostrongylus colubriformis]|uniref:Uncharacterized protein n=1 Tax=Trichostrongylus colubriformis TaxID=6319 RepID=A0AAN8FRK3_TRICO
MTAVMPTDDYLASLNIPQCSFDYDDEDQLRIHLMCAMLCSPKQVEDDGTVRADLVNKNAEEVTGGFMDLYTIGRRATRDDETEFKKITKNLERLFQHPMFSKIVEMDGQAKFHPVPPESIRRIYDRILRGGRVARRRDEQKESQKEREANQPEAVYKSKVACNFLMELIEKERDRRGLFMVEWQSIQKRYYEMVTDPDSEDRELMNTYAEKYGMDFSMPSLNSEVIKKWTGRSQVVKGLAMPLFHPVHYEMKGNILFVGFNNDAVLYKDEELERDREAWLAGDRPKERRYERERPKPVERERGNELEGVVPLRSRQAQTNRVQPLLTPDPSQSSPFATKAQPEQMYRQQWKPERPQTYASDEPQYIPTSAPPQADYSDSGSDSIDPINETGVFTDDEERPMKDKANVTQERKFQATNEWGSKEATSSPKSKSNSHVSHQVKPDDADRRQSPMMRKPANISDMLQPRANKWDITGGEDPEIMKPTARYASSASPHAPATTDSSFVQAPSPASAPRHRSAFEACKSFTGIQERDSELKPPRERSTPVDYETRSKGLYERRRNADVQQDRYDHRGNSDVQQDRYDRGGRDDFQQDRHDRRGNSDVQNDRYDRRGNDNQQDRYDRRGNDDQQDRYGHRGNDDQQDRYDRQGNDDHQDRYDRRGNSDVRQDRYDRRGNSDVQQERYDHRGNPDVQQDWYGGRENAGVRHDRHGRRGNADVQQDFCDRGGSPGFQQEDGYRRNGSSVRPYKEASGRDSRFRNERNVRSSETDGRYDYNDRDARDYSNSRNSSFIPENGRSSIQPGSAANESIFNRRIDESCIRRESSRMSSRNTTTRERSPVTSQRFDYRGSNDPPEGRRPNGNTGSKQDVSRDHDQRNNRNNSVEPDHPNHSSRDAESGIRASGFTSRQDSRQPSIQNLVGGVDAMSHLLGLHKAQSPMPTLEMDEQVCLFMIGCYAYMHRNTSVSGFRPLDAVLNLFPGTRSTDYWVQKIRAHLPNVELVPFQETFVVVWKEGAGSS